LVYNNILKCPSDPNIHKDYTTTTMTPSANSNKNTNRYENIPSMMITPASVSNSTSWNQEGSAIHLSNSASACASPLPLRDFQ